MATRSGILIEIYKLFSCSGCSSSGETKVCVFFIFLLSQERFHDKTFIFASTFQ